MWARPAGSGSGNIFWLSVHAEYAFQYAFCQQFRENEDAYNDMMNAAFDACESDDAESFTYNEEGDEIF